jgi:NAD(P)-dependent dehydrogenase (short-subunit alcohol dehydrogenase family)
LYVKQISVSWEVLIIGRRFLNKTVILTGGATGIGRETAFLLADEGAAVAIFDINTEEANKTAETIREKGGTTFVFNVDISDGEAVERAVAKAEEALGKVDILINNAGLYGGGYFADFLDTSRDNMRKIIEVNLLGTMFVTQSVAKVMAKRKSGKIVNVASVAGMNGIAKMADYSAAKGGVIAFTKVMAQELAQYHINVNCVSPGSIDTRGGSPQTLLGRAGLPSEAADLIAFLASEDANFITGQNIAIDGGRTLSMKW